MNLTSKQLQGELIAISGNSPDNPPETWYEMILHTKSRDYKIQRLISVDILRDYNHNYNDVITVVFEMPLGDFLTEVVGYRNNLAITLTAHTIGKKITESLKLILSGLDPKLLSGKVHNEEQHAKNREFVRLQGQCIDKTILSMREATSYGVYKDTTVGSVISSIVSEDLHVHSSLFGILNSGLKMVPADNSRTYDHIVIPSGTSTLAVPNYLQETYGVYNGDIGIYKQAFGGDNHLLIYPLYRPNLYSFFEKKLMIIAFADQQATAIDSSYAMCGSLLKILVNSNALDDDDETKHLSRGLSIRATEATSIIRRPFQIYPDKLDVKGENISRKMTHKKTESGTGPVTDGGVTSNLYKVRSDKLKNDGAIIQVKWTSSNVRLLSPMMPVTYVEERNGTVHQRTGLLQHVKMVADNNTKTENAILTIFIQHKKKSSGLGGIVSTLSKIF